MESKQDLGPEIMDRKPDGKSNNGKVCDESTTQETTTEKKKSGRGPGFPMVLSVLSSCFS